MPKGIPTAKFAQQTIRKAELEIIVPIDAKKFPGTDIPLPTGVSVRSANSVQIDFMYKGKRCTEAILGTPTIAHAHAAAKKRREVLQLIGIEHNTFNYAEAFPASRKVRSEQEHKKELANQEKKAEQEKLAIETLKIDQALDDWIVTMDESVGDNTFKDYSKDSKLLKELPRYRLQDPAIPAESRDRGQVGDVPVRDFDDIAINRLRSYLLTRPGAQDGTTLTEKRVNNLMTPLRGAMERLVDNKIIAHNPFTSVRPLSSKKAKRRKKKDAPLMRDRTQPLPLINGRPHKELAQKINPFSPEEVRAILGQLSGSFLNQIAFWMWTGLRTGELIALDWSDIDWVGQRIYIRYSLSRGIYKLPKFDKLRWVNLCEPAMNALKRQFEITGKNEACVFPNPFTGNMWANESKIRTRFKKALELAGVNYRRPYNCRHTYASTLLSSGENPLYVADQMGHNDWKMLEKVYARWMPEVDHLAGKRAEEMNRNAWQTLSHYINNHQSASGSAILIEDDQEENAMDEMEEDEEEFEL